MDLNKYQKESGKTAIYPNRGRNFIYPTLGLAGEAGEVADKIKKVIRDNGGKISKEARLEIIKEIGDVLWYVAQLSTEMKVTLSEVAKTNLQKLKSRALRRQIPGSGDNR